MTENFDDELARMDELEEQADSALFEALSLDDPIKGLTLRHHPTVQSGSTLQSVIDILRKIKIVIWVHIPGKVQHIPFMFFFIQ